MMEFNNSGTSLVEVVAGFVLMAIVFTSFIKIINLSSDMTQTSIDIKKANEDIKQNYYNGYNYQDNGKSVFSVSDGLPVELKEVTKDSSGNFVLKNSDADLKLLNTKLYVIEDKTNTSNGTIDFFARYVYTKPVILSEGE